MSESTITDRVLNMSHTEHSRRSRYKLMSTYWEMAYLEPYQRSKKERFGKIIIAFNCFRKTHHPKSLRGF